MRWLTPKFQQWYALIRETKVPQNSQTADGPRLTDRPPSTIGYKGAHMRKTILSLLVLAGISQAAPIFTHIDFATNSLNTPNVIFTGVTGSVDLAIGQTVTILRADLVTPGVSEQAVLYPIDVTINGVVIPSTIVINRVQPGSATGNMNWLNSTLPIAGGNGAYLQMSTTIFQAGVTVDVIASLQAPEPSTWIMLAAGLTAIGLRGRVARNRVSRS